MGQALERAEQLERFCELFFAPIASAHPDQSRAVEFMLRSLIAVAGDLEPYPIASYAEAVLLAIRERLS